MKQKRKADMKTPIILCVLAAAFAIYAGTSMSEKDSMETSAAVTEAAEIETETEIVTETETETEDPLKDYPESLVAFMEKYPEATQFVLDYPKYKDVHNEIDITGEVTKGELPLFLQWDVRWGYERYGSDFLAVTGCGPTCLSMVQCGLSGETVWNPYEVAKMAEREGFYVTGQGSSWDLMGAGAEMLGLQVNDVVLSAEDITDTLRAGMPIICSVGPGDFTDAGHFIVLAGVNTDGSIQVNDPNSRINSEKAWDIERILPQIKGMWAYRFDGTNKETPDEIEEREIIREDGGY
ncbi:MAG: C39 family peptidase [Marvinbryantia sp.]|uniref:C39 family peptidase n=1 Tax=Marvinbryantia sp. TaxID=2496532 RepID=UPI00399C46AD